MAHGTASLEVPTSHMAAFRRIQKFNAPAKAGRSSEPEPEEERPNPFKLLLKEIGIDRDWRVTLRLRA